MTKLVSVVTVLIAAAEIAVLPDTVALAQYQSYSPKTSYPPKGLASPQQYFVAGKPANQQNFQAAQIMQQAIDLLNQNRTAESLPKFEQVLAMTPDLALAHSNYALALAKSGRTDQAISELQKALSLDPNLPYALITLGGLYQLQGKLDQAAQTYADFLNRCPNHPDSAKIKNIAAAVDKMRATSSAALASVAVSAVAVPEHKNVVKPQVSADYFADVTSQSGVFKFPANKMPLRVWIKPVAAAKISSETSGSSATAGSSAIAGYRNNFPAIFKKSFEDWARVSGGMVKFEFVDSGSCDIECTWTADANQFTNSAETGETRLTMTKSGKILHGNIDILTVPLDQSLPLTDNRLRTICLHEIGHALGLTGHTRNPDDIMFLMPVDISDKRPELQSRDINTLIRLYSNSPSHD